METSDQGRKNWTIEYYVTERGRCPAGKYLESLRKKTPIDHAFIEKDFDRLEKHGPDLGRPYIEYLRDHIRATRTRVKRKRYRFLCFLDKEDQKIVITHGYPKTADKVLDSEIDKAIEYRIDYFNRKREGRLK